jgi:hypothetical protein
MSARGPKQRIVARDYSLVRAFGRNGFRVRLSLSCGHVVACSRSRAPRLYVFCKQCLWKGSPNANP